MKVQGRRKRGRHKGNESTREEEERKAFKGNESTREEEERKA